MTCTFCRIAAGEIPADKVLEDEAVIAFHDLVPQAPTHLLVIPRAHVSGLDVLADPDLAAGLLLACAEAARRAGLENGYRVVSNVGADGGQSVDHLHLHVLGGRLMTWPPG